MIATLKKNLVIRRANRADATAIVDLLAGAFAPYKSFYTREGYAATTPPVSEVEARITQKAVWLCLHDFRVVGTVSVFPRDNELFVRSMAVQPLYAGQGIGQMLMRHVHEMAYAKGCLVIRLNTTPFLSAAIRLYEKSGFVPEGNGDLFGTPLIQMKKDLRST